jgi:hypothetical protein
MSNWKLILPAAILMGGFLVCSTTSYGKAEYTKTTKKACVYCHKTNEPAKKDVMQGNLTDAGKYYKEHKSLDGYTEKK